MLELKVRNSETQKLLEELQAKKDHMMTSSKLEGVENGLVTERDCVHQLKQQLEDVNNNVDTQVGMVVVSQRHGVAGCLC